MTAYSTDMHRRLIIAATADPAWLSALVEYEELHPDWERWVH